jgi:hypothetical protein
MSELTDTILELQDALPKVERLNLNGVGIEIRPFKFIQFADALQTISPILNYLTAVGIEDPANIISAICGNAKVFVGLAKLATGQDEAFLAELEAVDGLKIIRAVIRLNMDFFKEEVPQLLKDLFPASPEEAKKQA